MGMTDSQNIQQQQEEEEEEQQGQQFHVLAVDDSLIDRKLLEKLLSFSSYKVTCVDSGDKALEYLGLVDELNNTSSPSSSSTSSSSLHQEGLKVNLIITDYCMPGMSGYDLLKRVKGSYWKDVPVVVMSSENVPSRIRMCLEEGAKEFLLKPLKLSDLNKLHPYLLKSLNNSCEDNSDNSSEAMETSSKNNNISNKRKAKPAVKIPEKRPKIEGLAVI